MTGERDMEDMFTRRLVTDHQAEQILSGTADPDDLGGGLADVAAILGAARGAATPDEFGTVQIGAISRAINSTPFRSTPEPERSSLLSRISGRATAAVVAGAILSAGAAAAATGNLPGPLQRTLSRVYSHVAGDMPVVNSTSATSHSPTGSASATSSDNSPPSSTPVGPNASGPAMAGLCNAYRASNAKSANGVAFQNLAKAAADAGQTIDQFCSSVSSTTSTSAPPSSTTALTTTGQGVGPDVTGPAKDGLCNAYLANGKGKNMDAVAFRNLTNAATQAGQTVDEFCAGTTPGNSGTTTSSGSSTSTTAKAHGKP